MFSFTSALNPSPHFPSSSYHPLSPPAFSEHDPDDMFFHQHQCESLCGSFLPINGSFPQNLVSFPVAENPTVTGQNNGDPLGDSEFLAKIPVKKDRHSKIYTSRGLRDRRVRLSIDIARNFFDLQDMLGFDKASTTLDWLLTKSRKAIEEVARMKKGLSGCAKNLSSSSECEVVSGENLAEIISKSGSLAAVSKEKKMKGTDEATAHILAKESRAKARARARERAREKMRTGMLPESEKCLKQFRPPTQLEACERSSKLVAQIEPSYLLLPDQAPRANVTEESIAIRRKLKSPGRLLYQPNLVIPKDLSSSSQNSSSFPNLPVNCAIPVMNLSKELHIRGKAIEGSISQRFP